MDPRRHGLPLIRSASGSTHRDRLDRLAAFQSRRCALCDGPESHSSNEILKVSDGTRTRDRLDHNQELYLLSYAHHAAGRLGRSAFGI
jgi:hypothetical protein